MFQLKLLYKKWYIGGIVRNFKRDSTFDYESHKYLVGSVELVEAIILHKGSFKALKAGIFRRIRIGIS